MILWQPMIVYPIPSLGWFPARPVARGWQVSPAHRPSPREAASATGSGGVSGEPSCWVLIIFVVTTAVAKGDRRCLVSVGASASLPGWKRQLPGAVPAVPWSWPSRCRPGSLQVVAEVEVGGESVSQILGGEVVQRCPGHGSCDRSYVVSLIVDLLHELRQCRPVA